MEPVRTIVQTWKKNYSQPYEVAYAYIKLVVTLNQIHLTPREMQLLAFTAVKGSISSGGAKKLFIEQFNSSMATVGNLIHTLSQKGALVKEGKHIRPIPAFRLDFTKNVSLVFKLEKTNDQVNQNP